MARGDVNAILAGVLGDVHGLIGGMQGRREAGGQGLLAAAQRLPHLDDERVVETYGRRRLRLAVLGGLLHASARLAGFARLPRVGPNFTFRALALPSDLPDPSRWESWCCSVGDLEVF